MQIIRSGHENGQGFRAIEGEVSLTIGNFDGFHLGHQALVQAALHQAQQQGKLRTAVVTFSPHPDDFFRKNAHPTPLLLSPRLKLQAASELGVEVFFEQTFDQAFAVLAAEAFFEAFLMQALSCRAIAVGQKFRFGRGRAGDTSLLQGLCQQRRVALEVVLEKQGPDGLVISSSRIRQALSQTGDVSLAQQLLGRPYLIAGEVQRGNQLGRTIGFPTLNVQPEDARQLLPQAGVYCGWLWLQHHRDGEYAPVFADTVQLIPAVMNLGVRPTVAGSGQGGATTLEVHAIDQQLPLDGCYGLRAGVYFRERLRGEEKFSSLEALKAAIGRDLQLAKTLLAGKNVHINQPNFHD